MHLKVNVNLEIKIIKAFCIDNFEIERQQKNQRQLATRVFSLCEFLNVFIKSRESIGELVIRRLNLYIQIDVSGLW